MVENVEYMERIAQNLNKMPQVKAIIVYDPELDNLDSHRKRYSVELYLWRDFMQVGVKVTDEMLEERI